MLGMSASSTYYLWKLTPSLPYCHNFSTFDEGDALEGLPIPLRTSWSMPPPPFSLSPKPISPWGRNR